jgi:Family of unknown function (DUF6209)
MSMQTTARDQTMSQNPQLGTATIRFRRDQVSSGVSRLGRLRPGGVLRIEYDPLRLLDSDSQPHEIVAHVRFEPSQEVHSSLLHLSASAVQAATGRPGLATHETTIPDDASLAELWFERRTPTGSDGWDSRYGRNYRFAVTPDGLPVPEASVALRAEAIIDPGRISVVDDAASKAQVATSATGSALGTELKISAKVTGADRSTVAWADIHVFDATDDVVHTGTLELQGPGAASEQTVVQTWSAYVYQGSGGGSGAGVWSRPDVHSVQYRLYCRMDDRLFTDGVLHQFDVPPDAEIRPIPGAPPR